MNPQKVFFDRLAAMPLELQYAHVRSVYFRVEDGWRLASARVTFAKDPSGSERHDHRDILFLARSVARQDALTALRQVVDTKATTGLALEQCPPFSQSPDILSRPESMPVPFGQGRRLTGWPEYRFRFRGEFSMNAPSLPIVRPGIPIVADAWEAVEAWMHEPRSHNSDVALDVVVPMAGARISHVAVGPDAVRVRIEGTAGTDVRMHFSGSGEVDVSNQAVEFVAALDDGLPDTVSVFLVNMHDDVLDWAQIRPRHDRPSEGIAVTWPLATLENAIALGEGPTTEFKSDCIRPNRDDVLETACAFANTQGGSIYFGVTDEGVIAGLPDAKKTLDRVHDWFNTLLEPRPEWTPRIVQLHGVDLLVVDVQAGTDRPYMVKGTGKCYVRRGASDFTMSRSELLVPRGHPSFPMGRRRLGF